MRIPKYFRVLSDFYLTTGDDHVGARWTYSTGKVYPATTLPLRYIDSLEKGILRMSDYIEWVEEVPFMVWNGNANRE